MGSFAISVQDQGEGHIAARMSSRYEAAHAACLVGYSRTSRFPALERFDDLAVAKLRLLHAELTLNEKILLLFASFGRGDYQFKKELEVL